MHTRIARIPNYLISLLLIALLAAALVAGQARANLHPEIRVSSAFHASTDAAYSLPDFRVLPANIAFRAGVKTLCRHNNQ
jgi:hypothetical protein